MEAGTGSKNFAELATIRIGIVPGDGIGPIIMKQAVRVLEKLPVSDGDKEKIAYKNAASFLFRDR